MTTLREQRGFTQEELASAADVSTATVSRYESGAISPFADRFRRIAETLEVSSPTALCAPAPPEARLLGEVGAGAEVFPLDEDGHRFPAPPGMDTPVAVRVTGTSMVPAYREGDLLFAEEASLVGKDVVGRDCILQTGDGRRLVKRVHRGSGAGWFRLFSYETQDFSDDLRLAWASPIRWIQRA